MLTMEDSGIDSEDKLSPILDDNNMSAIEANSSNRDISNHMDNFDVIFRNKSTNEEQRLQSPAAAEDVSAPTICRTQPPNTCRILQRKLELKVERAKRNYNQYQEDGARKTQASNMIPINRLSIPGTSEKKPLVDYNSDSSDDPEELSFFAAKTKHKSKRATELSDTFSIQEMTIESDLESDDSGGSQNLELLPPVAKNSVLDMFAQCFNCRCIKS